MDRIKRVLDDAFRIKNLGTLKYFLGLEVAYSKKGISPCQRSIVLICYKIQVC